MLNLQHPATATSGTQVLAVHCGDKHRFSKPTVNHIVVEAGLGVLSDAHCGATVQHRYQKRWRPQAPNLRQVHLISANLLALCAQHGFDVAPGALGENITLADAPGWGWQDLMDWPAGTQLHFAQDAVLELTGWRKPCVLIDRFQAGLRAVLEPETQISASLPWPYRTGVMATVHTSGPIQASDAVQLQWPAPPFRAMECV